MHLRAPKTITFIVAVILAVLGAAGHYGVVNATASYAFLLLLIGFIVLAMGNLTRGL